MNSTENRLYKVVMAFIPNDKITLSKKEVDEYFRKCLHLFEDELEEIDTEDVREALYFFWKSTLPKDYRMRYEEQIRKECKL